MGTLFLDRHTFTSGRTHLQAEAGMAGGGNELIERQSEVYIERLTTGCQVHCRQSMMQSISPPASGLKECTRTVAHHVLIKVKSSVRESCFQTLKH